MAFRVDKVLFRVYKSKTPLDSTKATRLCKTTFRVLASFTKVRFLLESDKENNVQKIIKKKIKKVAKFG